MQPSPPLGFEAARRIRVWYHPAAASSSLLLLDQRGELVSLKSIYPPSERLSSSGLWSGREWKVMCSI